MITLRNITSPDFCGQIKECVKGFIQMLETWSSRIYCQIALIFYHAITLREGSQNYCLGPIESHRVQQICNQLNTDRIQGVFFNTVTAERNMRGGTCSAMTLDYIDQYLRLKAHGKTSFESLIKITPRYRTSSQEFMNHQAAFNTISKHPQEISSDFKRDKIAAMLKLFQRRVGVCSEEIRMDAPDARDKILRNMAVLPKGVFVVRALAYEQNAREEREGHSMAFINEEDGLFLYDPNHGTTQLKPGHSAEQVHLMLKDVHEAFEVPSVRMYQVL